jgi:List-Bact-rpt repeat protein
MRQGVYAFVGLIAAMSLSASLMARAQAPAGPNRPGQVPEGYVVTPFGYFHPSCVVHLAKAEELAQGGRTVKKSDGSIYNVPACGFPHYTAQGEMFDPSLNKPPFIRYSWILTGETTIPTSYGKILADWKVPAIPQSPHGQTIYFFPGLEDSVRYLSILQPVLGWNSDYLNAWGIASWNCCITGNAWESQPIAVTVGDHIIGTVESTCGRGTLSCPTWNITTRDESTGRSTTLPNAPSNGQTFNWAFGGVLEVYGIAQCSDYPSDKYITFHPTLYDNNFQVIENPYWQLVDLSSGLLPQCNYGGQVFWDRVTLAFGTYNLMVSTSGNGSVISDDGSINCPGTCMQTYEAGSEKTLNAWPAYGWGFAGWSGACTGSGSCNVAITQDQTVSASFLPLHTLTVTTSGNGSVSSADGFINCPGVCSHSYLANSPVTLIANPALGWSLDSWGGACSGNGACNVVMGQDQSVSATFTQDYYTLTVSTAGQGIVTSTDGFINCPGTCNHTYLSLTPVTLNASPAQGWTLSGWTGACMGVGACNFTMTQNLAATAVFIEPGNGLQFRPVTPCRLVDTRQSSPIQGGTEEDFVVPQLGNCNIPESALAYSLNVTAVPRGHLSYLTIWPTGEAQPTVSTLNSPDGRVKANAAIVPAGTNGAVSVYVTNTTDVILDIDGYFRTPGQQTYQFYPLPPCRVIDTRGPTGDLGGPFLSGGRNDGSHRDLPVRESTTCIPADANVAAYSLNFTAAPHVHGQRLGYLTVWPEGSDQPVVSTLNNPTGTVVANAAIVPPGTNGGISVFAYDDTDIIADINGYFGPAGQGGYSFYPAAPCRAYDSRNNNGQPFQGTKVVNIAGSPCAPPATARGYVFNATVVPDHGHPMGYLTLWPDGENMPLVSTLNAYDGLVTSNMAIVPNINGSIDAYADGLTHLILDISGYFAP